MTIFWSHPNIESILAYFGDSEYTVKIDRLRTGEIRYLCWHKSKSIFSEPNLILRNGKVKEAENGESVEYTFFCDDRVFTVEHFASRSKGGTAYYFLEVTDKDQKKSTWKMEHMSIPKYLR